MYCGSCMRDNAIVAALRKLGHDALLIPLYTPLLTDEPDNSMNRIFFGGLNVYLQQKSPLFRMTPEWFERRLDNPDFIRFATGFSIKTQPEMLGGLMISMLKGEEGNQHKELEKLIVWLKKHSKAEVLCISNALLTGMARRLKAELKIPIICTLQGEDFFLDGLLENHRVEAWNLLRECVQSVDGFIAVSQYYADTMQKRLGIPSNKIHVVLNGIETQGYSARPPAAGEGAPAPRIGFLARMAPEKGLLTLIEAFKLLRQRGKIPGVELHVAGSMTPADRAFFDIVQSVVKRDGLSAHVKFLPNLLREDKVAFLQSLSVLSVPATYGESFGLYLLEALACGVPFVQPDHGPFPEILAATGGGVLCKPNDPLDLAEKLEELLLDEPRRRELGAGGRRNVLAKFNIERVARGVAEVFESHIITGAGHGQ